MKCVLWNITGGGALRVELDGPPDDGRVIVTF
jgi:hypothetical protein